MGRSWELAPAYDVTHAYNPQGEWTYQHLISVDGKFNSISRADLLVEADRFGVRRPLDILAGVRAALDNWPNYANAAGLSNATANVIATDFEVL